MLFRSLLPNGTEQVELAAKVRKPESTAASYSVSVDHWKSYIDAHTLLCTSKEASPVYSAPALRWHGKTLAVAGATFFQLHQLFDKHYGEHREVNAEQAAELLSAARSVIITPGYGMAVSQAQRDAVLASDTTPEVGQAARSRISIPPAGAPTMIFKGLSGKP